MDDAARRIIAKIRALQAKTVDAGATVEEAAAAAGLAAELMRKYEIDSGDVAAAEYDRLLLPLKGVNLDAARSHPFVYAGEGINHLSGCRSYLSPLGMYVVGDEVGRTMAHYLYDMVRNVIDAAWRIERTRRRERMAPSYQKVTGQPLPARVHRYIHDAMRDSGLAHDRIAQRSFGMGMASMISDRMLAMTPAREVPAAAVERVMADKTECESKRAKAGAIDASALHVGRKLGKDVPIGMGVDAARGGAPLLIGRDVP